MSGWIAGAIIVGSAVTYKGMQDQKKASKAQTAALQKQGEVESRMANLQASRERREQFRQARAAQGGLIQAGATAGTMGSSGVTGGMSSVAAQLGSNVSFLDSMSSMADQASIFSQEAANQQGAILKAQQLQQTGQMIGSAGTTLGGKFG